jgi:hypothetical protein
MKPGSLVEHKNQGFFRTAAVVFIATMLAACGSSTSQSSKTTATGSPSTNSGTSFDSCSVVTQEDAASALGETVTAGVGGAATVEGGRACVFYGPSAPKPPDPDVGQPDSVRVVVVKGPDASSWYNDYKSKVNAQPVSGYGDQAYYDGFASLNILEGTNYLRVAVIPAIGSPSLSGEQKLAAAILRRL